jgi:hypothetical protein
MKTRQEMAGFKPQDWSCVKVQSPHGVVTLARRLPAVRPSSAMSNWITRRFASSNPQGLIVRRLRLRRSAEL